MNINFNDLFAVGAEITLAITGLLILLAEMIFGNKRIWLLVLIALVGIVAAGVISSYQFDASQGAFAIRDGFDGAYPVVNEEHIAMDIEGDGPVIVDNFAVIFRYIFLLGLGLTVLLSVSYVKREEMPAGEYFALLIFCTLGMMVMAGAGDLLTLFVGLETLSIPIYILAGYQRNKIRSNEAGFKYLIIGAFASSFFLYGIAFIYGATGTLNLSGIADALTTMSMNGVGETSFYMLIGSILFFIGFAFKIAAVPFHMWTPDVYQGAPTAITAYMSVAVKAAAFAGLLRVLLIIIPFEALTQILGDVIQVVAILTMTIGNLLAIHQKSVKRMLAYSSIAHAGYLLVGVLAAFKLHSMEMAIGGIMFYLVAYTLMNIGAFGVLILVARKGDKYENAEDFAGLARTHPALAMGMALFMLSLAGFPPTAGFFGKFYLFSAAVSAGLTWLVVIAVLNSLVSVVYYFRPIMNMYFKPVEDTQAEREEITFPGALQFALYFSGIAILLLGLLPNSIMYLVSLAVSY